MPRSLQILTPTICARSRQSAGNPPPSTFVFLRSTIGDHPRHPRVKSVFELNLWIDADSVFSAASQETSRGLLIGNELKSVFFGEGVKSCEVAAFSLQQRVFVKS
jgi:hypothetical protein